MFVSPAKHGRHIGVMTPVALSWASSFSALSHFWFLIDNSRRDASILGSVKHHTIQVKFDKGGNPQKLTE